MYSPRSSNRSFYRIGNGIYNYPNSYYDRLDIVFPTYFEGALYLDGEPDNDLPHVLCSKCWGARFHITYGEYKCIAHCRCGHEFVIYDG